MITTIITKKGNTKTARRLEREDINYKTRRRKEIR